MKHSTLGLLDVCRFALTQIQKGFPMKGSRLDMAKDRLEQVIAEVEEEAARGKPADSNKDVEIKRVKKAMLEIEMVRGDYVPGTEIRHYCNEAVDRLDALCSVLVRGERPWGGHPK